MVLKKLFDPSCTFIRLVRTRDPIKRKTMLFNILSHGCKKIVHSCFHLPLTIRHNRTDVYHFYSINWDISFYSDQPLIQRPNYSRPLLSLNRIPSVMMKEHCQDSMIKDFSVSLLGSWTLFPQSKSCNLRFDRYAGVSFFPRNIVAGIPRFGAKNTRATAFISTGYSFLSSMNVHFKHVCKSLYPF